MVLTSKKMKRQKHDANCNAHNGTLSKSWDEQDITRTTTVHQRKTLRPSCANISRLAVGNGLLGMRVPSRTCSSRTTMASTGTLAHDLGLILLRLDTGAVVLGLLGRLVAE